MATLHRASNTDSQENLENITKALIKLGELGEIIIFPIHPRTEKLLRFHGLFDRLKQNTKLIEPLGYLIS